MSTSLQFSLHPQSHNLITADFHAWLPPSSSPIRCILGISAYATGGLFQHPAWRHFATQNHAGLLLYDLQKPKIDNRITHVAPDPDGFSALLAALTHLSEKLRRPELLHAPLFFTGLSKAAEQAAHYAALAGPRALAAICFQCPVGLRLHEAVIHHLATVPILCPFTQFDAFFPSEMMQSQNAFVFTQHPSAPWAGLYRPNLPHHLPGNQTFPLRWLQSILDLRLPSTPGEPLRPLNPLAGIFAELRLNDSLQPTARLEASPTAPILPAYRHWLPTPEVAQAWRLANTQDASPESETPTSPLKDDHTP